MGTKQGEDFNTVCQFYASDSCPLRLNIIFLEIQKFEIGTVPKADKFFKVLSTFKPWGKTANEKCELICNVFCFQSIKTLKTENEYQVLIWSRYKYTRNTYTIIIIITG